MNEVLKKKVESSSKEELLIILLDGAISFVKKAQERMNADEYAAANEYFIKAERIILELIKCVNPKLLDDKLYKDLIGLYLFCYRKLYMGNIKKDVESVDEAFKILSNLRDMWKEAVEKFKKDQSGAKIGAGYKPGSLDTKS
ncbi:MAG: flagellar export chaperone FliS [Planctomycetes bacterium]|nr:flagellar export chaperone FliS [Planctomycetota bacterium]